MSKSDTENNSDDIQDIKKYVGIESDNESHASSSKGSKKKNMDKKKNVIRVGFRNYDKILSMCEKEKICIYVQNNKKKPKTYEQLLEACNKKKRDIIKEYLLKMAPYGMKKGYAELAGTYVIESLSDSMVTKLRSLDKVIELIKKEIKPDKKSNIMSLMNIKKITEDSFDVNDIVLEEYSDNL